MKTTDSISEIVFGGLMHSMKIAAKIDGRSTEGCAVYRPKSFITRILNPICRHKVNIDDLIRIDPNVRDLDIWLRKDIDAVIDWLEENCIGNYKLVIVPSDETFTGYSFFKENRICFSSSVDVMAFKLKHL